MSDAIIIRPEIHEGRDHIVFHADNLSAVFNAILRAFSEPDPVGMNSAAMFHFTLEGMATPNVANVTLRPMSGHKTIFSKGVISKPRS